MDIDVDICSQVGHRMKTGSVEEQQQKSRNGTGEEFPAPLRVGPGSG